MIMMDLNCQRRLFILSCFYFGLSSVCVCVSAVCVRECSRTTYVRVSVDNWMLLA